MKKNTKKIFTLIGALFAGAMTLSLTGCLEETHQHTFSSEWSSNSTSHWHTATCGHDVKSDEGTHTFGEWVIDTEATETAEGLKHRNCSVCSYKEEQAIPSPAHQHTFSSEWTSDSSTHWHEATCGHDVKGSEAAHIFGAWVIDTEATETAEGLKHRNCTVCNYKEEETIPVKTPTTADAWTVMIYLCGSDLESGDDGYGGIAALATEDLKEILSVSNQPDDVNIIVETGGAKKWSSKYGISSKKLERWHVANKKLVKDDSLTYAGMGKTTTFQSFLEWGLTEYPAEKVGVILWNHGGAMGGVCYDENDGDDSLSASEIDTAFNNVFDKYNIEDKFEFIGYDACLMQVQDIAEINSQYFKYMVGSEESEAGDGWRYDYWVDDLYAKKDTDVILKAICDGFIDAYDELYGKQGYANDQTQSYLDLSKMANYKAKFEEFASTMSSIVKKSSFNTFIKKVKNYGDTYMNKSDYQYYLELGYSADMFDKVVEDGQTYYLLHGYYDFAVFDAKDFFTKLKASTLGADTAKINAALNALEEVICYNRIGDDAGKSYGLSLVCPVDEYSATNCYPEDDTNFTTWQSIVTSSSRNY